MIVVVHIFSNNYSKSKFKITPTLMSFSHQCIFLSKREGGGREVAVPLWLRPQNPARRMHPWRAAPVCTELRTLNAQPVEGKESAKSAPVCGGRSGL